MGRCITIITLTGATSLGLLTGSLTYQSMKAIPELVRQLNNEASLKTASAESVLTKVKTNLTVTNAVNIVLTTLSTWLFSTAYRSSPAAGKHPFLIYSAIGAPLALATFYYQAGNDACCLMGPFSRGEGIKEVIRIKLAKVSKKLNRKKVNKDSKRLTALKVPQVPKGDELLDHSYINISEESLSRDSSPETPIEAVEAVSPSIEDEVGAALNKKERVTTLESIGSAYSVASAIAGVAFAVCSIGVIGDQFFL